MVRLTKGHVRFVATVLMCAACHAGASSGDDCERAARKLAARIGAEMGSNVFNETDYAAQCRERTNPRHLTAVHDRKQVDCVLGADSDNDLISCMKVSKTTEASVMLKAVGDALQSVVRTAHTVPTGTASSASTGDLCALSRREVKADWSAPVWKMMHVDFIDHPGSFDNPQYALSYAGDSSGFRVEAVGDADCDGKPATWILTGTVVDGEAKTTIQLPPLGVH